MIETTTIRFTLAAAPARCRFRAEVVKKAVASSWSGDGPVAASMTVSTPTSASSRPSPVTTSTPLERAIWTTSCPRCSRISTRCDPSRPVAPVTAIFWLLLSVCIVLPFRRRRLGPAIGRRFPPLHPYDERGPLRSTGLSQPRYRTRSAASTKVRSRQAAQDLRYPARSRGEETGQDWGDGSERGAATGGRGDA